MTTVKLTIDEQLCAATGACTLAYPARFDLVDGYAVIIDDSSVDADEAARIAEVCPMAAIGISPDA
jgi:ferredoxin